MKKIFILLISLATLLSCSNDDDNEPQVNIRVSNISEFDFENVVVKASTENVNVNMQFELLSSGQMTEYKSFNTANIFPLIELQIDGESYTILPYSTGFDQPLEPGNYTYQINADDSQEQFNRLSFMLITE